MRLEMVWFRHRRRRKSKKRCTTKGIYMEFRKMVTITLCTRQQKRHWYIEQSYGLCAPSGSLAHPAGEKLDRSWHRRLTSGSFFEFQLHPLCRTIGLGPVRPALSLHQICYVLVWEQPSKPRGTIGVGRRRPPGRTTLWEGRFLDSENQDS